MLNKKSFHEIIASNSFLKISCALIFLLSIFFRSIVDIGADTGVYIQLGKKVALGQRYYFDFFESNFPLSFWYYALQYQISKAFNLSPIFLSEFFINLLALLSLFWSSRIMKKSTIYENRAHYNLILISFFLTFFLRYNALAIGEFGTKTSLLLILLYPYIAFCLERKTQFSRKELVARGVLMGLIPCVKPHYLLLILFPEIHRFWKQKKLRFFFELDKLVMMLVGTFYLFLMIKFTPEFFRFIVPMWPKTYSAYDNFAVFLENFWRHIAARVGVFSFIFLIFARSKMDANDKILSLFFASSAILIILENIGTVDQVVTFYGIATICFSKFLYDFFCSKKILISENKFIIASLIFLPAFDMEILPASIFGLGGFVNIWWFIALVYPLILVIKKQIKFSPFKFFAYFAIYILMALIAVLTLKHAGGWAYIAVNLTFLFAVLFFFEKKIYAKISPRFSPFFVFVVATSVSCLLYSYITSIAAVLTRDSPYTSPNKLTDTVAYYSKIYAPQKEDGTLMLSIWIAHQFPLLNYLEKDNHQKFHIAALQADKGIAGSPVMFPINDRDLIFTLSYLFDDVKSQLENPQVKVLFVNNSPEILDKKTRCMIGTLEYYFSDPQFKKFFLENFHFENHVVITEKVKPVGKVRFLTGEKASVFDKVEPTTKRVLHDIEIYVKNEKK